MLVGVHRHQPRSGECERLHGCKVGGLFDQHDVAGIDEHLADEEDALLGAAGDLHLVGVGRQRPGEAGRHLLEQFRLALGCGVLQRPGALVGEHVVEGRTEVVQLEQGRVRDAAGEGDHVTGVHHGEDVAHRRRGDAGEAVGKLEGRAHGRIVSRLVAIGTCVSEPRHRALPSPRVRILHRCRGSALRRHRF